jgi:hypothetical protein
MAGTKIPLSYYFSVELAAYFFFYISIHEQKKKIKSPNQSVPNVGPAG